VAVVVEEGAVEAAAEGAAAAAPTKSRTCCAVHLL
jgi:hypothetical protein